MASWQSGSLATQATGVSRGWATRAAVVSRGWATQAAVVSRGWATRAAVVAAAGLVAVVFGFGSLPVGAQAPVPQVTGQGACSPVRLVLSNPLPGDLLTPGDYLVQGNAVDTSAPAAPGIDRVQLFWDLPRDSGGHLIGEVDAGQDAPDEHLNATGFQVIAHIPNTTAQNNTHVLFAYARSGATGQEQGLSLEVQLKQPLSVGALTPTPTPPPVSLVVPPCSGPTPTPTFPPFPGPVVANATPIAGNTLTLRVSNPQAGDMVSSGTYVISGVAFDSSAASGTGIDQVQVFLDPRDDGGQFLGTATLGTAGVGGVFGFELVARLPNRTGGHTLSIYARSAVSDKESLVSIPIVVT
jgi:hypothetical protein